MERMSKNYGPVLKPEQSALQPQVIYILFPHAKYTQSPKTPFHQYVSWMASIWGSRLISDHPNQVQGLQVGGSPWVPTLSDSFLSTVLNGRICKLKWQYFCSLRPTYFDGMGIRYHWRHFSSNLWQSGHQRSVAVLKPGHAHVAYSLISVQYCFLAIILRGSWLCSLSSWFLPLNYPSCSIKWTPFLLLSSFVSLLLSHRILGAQKLQFILHDPFPF